MKKRITLTEDYDRFADGFISHYRKNLRKNPSESNYQKLLKDYAGEVPRKLKDETRDRVEKKLDIIITRSGKTEKERRTREYDRIGYVRGQQVYVYEEIIYIKKTGRYRSTARDSRGRFASLKKPT